MNLGLLRLLGWIALYVLLALAPLALVMVYGARPPARGILVEAGAMLGLLGLGVLAMQLVISGRHRWFAAGVGQDNLLQFHRQTGLFAWLLVLAHPATLIAGDPAFLAYLDPRVDALRAASLIFVVLGTSVLAVTSLWRVAMRLQYEWWRVIHGGLALLVVAAGLGHALLVDRYTGPLPVKAGLLVLVAVALVLLLESRLLRPWRMKRRPWTIRSVDAEAGDATRLVVEARGHSGMAFKPGQYAWLTIGDSPFSLQQHPFSMSSDATDRQRLEFTVRHAGDFTCSLPEVRPGTPAWLEGPYGVFTINPSAGRRAVFIAGGIGITPVISILRSCVALGFRRPMWLVYANGREDEIIYRAELEALTNRLPLDLAHVLSDPPDDWEGETGYVDRELLERVLPPDDRDIDYFVCGPPPMMDLVEPALRARGVALSRLRSERFDLV